MPVSTRITRSPVSTRRHRMVQVQRLFSSAGIIFCQMVLGTTPSMAPPSSLKWPVSMETSFMSVSDFLLLRGGGRANGGKGEGRCGCFRAFVSMRAAGPLAGLGLSLRREDAEDDRDARRQAQLDDPKRHGLGDIFVVFRLPVD